MSTNTSDELAVVVLAAGKGTRMKSDLPKVIHALAGRPMIDWVVDLAEALGAERTVVVVGHGADQVRAHLAGPQAPVPLPCKSPSWAPATRSWPPRPGWMNFGGEVIILYGDVPGLRRSTAQAAHRPAPGGRATTRPCLAIDRDPPPAYGRLILDGEDRLTRIVEERDATPEEKEDHPGQLGHLRVRLHPPCWSACPCSKRTTTKKSITSPTLAEIFHGRGLRWAMPWPRTRASCKASTPRTSWPGWSAAGRPPGAKRTEARHVMCGIIGYLGPGEAPEVIMDGLARLEYRGYDSAGLAVVTDQRAISRCAGPRASSAAWPPSWPPSR